MLNEERSPQERLRFAHSVQIFFIDRGIARRAHCCIAAMLLWTIMSALAGVAHAQAPTPVPCTGGEVQPQAINMGPQSVDSQPDLQVTGACTITASATPKNYFFRHVNIYDGGSLSFIDDGTADSIDFWSSGIIVENNSKLLAGQTTPFGQNGAVLTIHLYGKDQSNGNPVGNPGQGVLCLTKQNHARNVGPCGVPWDKWSNSGMTLWGTHDTAPLPAGVKDYFYAYDALYGDSKMMADPNNDPPHAPSPGYFGYKSLGISYGATLILNGYKGASPSIGQATQADQLNSGTSWARLKDGGDLAVGATSLTLATSVGTTWRQNDMAVVTSTDYLPGHSELIKLDSAPSGAAITFHACATPFGGPPADPTCPGSAGLEFTHDGTRYGGAQVATPNQLATRLNAVLKGSIDPNLVSNGAETRAAVALLSRSIRIVSAGDYPGDNFYLSTDATHPNYYFGGHTVFRQGFQQVSIDGVEFYQLGQGGRLGHYPVHFHMARHTPPGTIIADSSVWDSMTRWYVIHSTLGVTLARNVGYLSIGHGYYLEDGTETDNKLYSNIGIFARAAVVNPQNPRNVPGILADNSIGYFPGDPKHEPPLPPSWDPGRAGVDGFPFASDWNHPTVFWITNGWNDFSGNAAVGAGTCGACYWFASAYNSNITDDPAGAGGMKMTWWGYAGLQKDPSFAGTTPLKSFFDNTCSAAMNAFQTVGETAVCHGAIPAGVPAANVPKYDMVAVKSIAPDHKTNPADETYYPLIPGSQGRQATRCPPFAGNGNGPDGLPGYDCSAVLPCASGNANCAVTVLDHFTTAFTFAPYNFAAIWARPKWFLVDNSVISDIQGPGLTFVSGGDYTRSSVVEGYWAAVRNSLFIGSTQPQDDAHKYAAVIGPFTESDPSATPPKDQCQYNGDHCVNPSQGIAIQLDNFGVAQRLNNIYDGPTFEDHNAYLDIKATACPAGNPRCIYFHTPGLRVNANSGINNAPACFMPNAAIAWKQPNGFYYPPAFHSDNLQFDNVDIRHYVIEPLFKPTTYITQSPDNIATLFCGGNTQFNFNGYTDVDRQTELSDDDGSLTGLINNNPPPPMPPTGMLPPEPQTTISVNEDPFFQAPVETGECLSNVGVTAAGACPMKPFGTPQYTPPQTAETSPYDYLTTVVLPDCTQHPGDRTTELCGDGKNGRGGFWSADCAGPFCYGVPLYRQLLTGSDTTPYSLEYAQWITNMCNTPTPPNPTLCRTPFIRMSGQATYQRSTLTANHGVYYLDTTVPDNTQRTEAFTDPNTPDWRPCPPEPEACTTRSLNVFQAGKTYYVFFVFAKATTKQTYQIYVGDGFHPDTDVWGVRGNINVKPTQFGRKGSAANPWTTAPTYSNGILTVSVDLSAFVNDLSTLNTANGLCQPSTFCAWSGTGNAKTCGCKLEPGDPQLAGNPNLLAECTNTCGKWAVKDVDCPGDGCIGFAFKLPGDFETTTTSHRPQPVVFPVTTAGSGWQTKFLNTTTLPDATAGTVCNYATLPGGTGCLPN
jgi:hypothetical protein